MISKAVEEVFYTADVNCLTEKRLDLTNCSNSAGTTFMSMTTIYSGGPFVPYRKLSLEQVDPGGRKRDHLGRRCYGFIQKSWPMEENEQELQAHNITKQEDNGKGMPNDSTTKPACARLCKRSQYNESCWF